MSLKPSIYSLAEHGDVLATRDTGREAGRRAADALADSEALVLSFWGVEVASPPFLDELLRSLKVVLLGGTSQKQLVAAGLNEDVRESVEMVLERQGGAMAEIRGDQISLLGGSRQLKATLKEAERLGYFKAPELAQRLEVKLPNLHARLKQLAEAGAIARVESRADEDGSRAGAFQAPEPAVLISTASGD